MQRQTPSHTFERQIELLIDGELSLAEQRALAQSLEQRPEQWRRVALAFWEQQALQREVPLAQGDALGDSPATGVPPPAPSRWRAGWSRAGGNLALAAAVVLSFGLGWVANYSVPPPGPPTAAPPATGMFANTEPAGLGPHPMVLRPAGMARMAFDRDGQRHTYEAPVYQGDAAAVQAWLEQLPPAIDPRLTAELQRRGQRIERQVGLAPLRLENGLEAAIPVDAYRIVPVKGPAY